MFRDEDKQPRSLIKTYHSNISGKIDHISGGGCFVEATKDQDNSNKPLKYYRGVHTLHVENQKVGF